MNEETITISKKEYNSLKDDAFFLQCLQNAGVDNWKIPKIYITDFKNPITITKALKIMTDDWVDEGNYCAQTVIDLRDALIYYQEKCKNHDNQSRKTT
jgi:hypothetical protein